MPSIKRITLAKLEKICRALESAATHKQLTLQFKDAGIEEAGGNSKWERMLLALSQRQKKDSCSNSVLNFFQTILHPSNYHNQQELFTQLRTDVNFQLAFIGLSIGENGKLRTVEKSQTISEAQQRASEITLELQRRGVHSDVLKFCKSELLQENYFHCVLEVAKSIAQKIRDRTGLVGDGAKIAQKAFSISDSYLALNTLRTESEQMEQSGFSNLLTGIFGTFRNPTSHAPKIYWAVNKQDALDALTIFSYVHRRLDDARIVKQA